MKFQAPTPVQAASIPPALEGRDILGSAQTGTGKTGAFGVPLLALLYAEQGRQALIMAPSRELAAQIHRVLHQMGRPLGLRGVLVVGGESFGRQRDELNSAYDYVVATPGRLNDHLEQGEVDLSHVTFLVLDEADRMLDMGFIPQIRQVLSFLPRDRQTLLFSATLPKEIMGLAGTFLKNPVRVSIGAIDTPVSQVKETVIKTSNAGKTATLMDEVEAREGKIFDLYPNEIANRSVGADALRKGAPGGESPRRKKPGAKENGPSEI